MIVEHQRGEKPSADSPGCEEYYVLECDVCGECWEVGPDAEELEFNIHVCAECKKAEVEFRLSAILEYTRHLLAECKKAGGSGEGFRKWRTCNED